MEKAKVQGGVFGKLKQGVCAVKALAAFAGLYFMPVIEQEISAQARMEPAW
jgi:magnesium-protoporphyrin IX monomethyl ester (oxidative) cyclase